MKKLWEKLRGRKIGRTGRLVLMILALYALFVLAVTLVVDGRHVRFYMTQPQEITAAYGEEFTDPGCYAVTAGRLFGEGGRRLRLSVRGEVDTSKLGSYEIEYSAHWLFQEYSTRRTVTVVDKTPPEITLEYTEGYAPSWFTGYEEEGFTALANCDGDLTAKVEKKVLGDRIEYTVTDSSGNTASVERRPNYTVTAPVISLSGGTELQIYAGPSFADPGYSAADSLGNDLTGYVQVSGEVCPYLAGEYELNYCITNKLGETVSAVRTVTVLPAPLPETVEPDEKTIYLTFDDGPGPYTDDLLDLLQAYNVKATFFVTCLNEKYQDMVGRAADEGHSIGVHTASHNYRAIYAGEDAFFQDFNAVEEMIKEQTGAYTSLCRFPGGSSNTVSSFNPGIMTRLAKAVTDMGYQYFDWNVSSGDAGETTDTDQVAANIINGCTGRKASVVLQHDIKDYSVAAVEQVINWGLSNGYTFRPLDLTSPGAHHGIAN